MATGDYEKPTDPDVRAVYVIVVLALLGLVVLRKGFKGYPGA